MLRDVKNEFVSVESARDDYGVVIDVQTWTVDGAGTEQRRAELRARRTLGPVIQR